MDVGDETSGYQRMRACVCVRASAHARVCVRACEHACERACVRFVFSRDIVLTSEVRVFAAQRCLELCDRTRREHERVLNLFFVNTARDGGHYVV